MERKYVLMFVGVLMGLNVFAWQDVFVLAKAQDLRVVFLDVGQGDSAFIQTPENHQILIDGGPTSAVLGKLGERMPFWDKSLDLVTLTHPESDHMQGLLDVLKVYKADYILWNGVKKVAPEYTAWIKVLAIQKKMGAKILIAKSGQEIVAGSVLIDTLYPLKSMEGQEIKSSANDTCVVSRVIYGKNSFLFTGDIDAKAEKELVNSGEIIASDVLKVAHHGSKYSSSDIFLQAVKSTAAVIEVGKNTFGHPTPETLQRLQNAGDQTLRTDQKGDIVMISNGNNIVIK